MYIYLLTLHLQYWLIYMIISDCPVNIIGWISKYCCYYLKLRIFQLIIAFRPRIQYSCLFSLFFVYLFLYFLLNILSKHAKHRWCLKQPNAKGFFGLNKDFTCMCILQPFQTFYRSWQSLKNRLVNLSAS